MTGCLRFTPLLLCVFLVACGDDSAPPADAGADTGALDAGSDAGSDAATDAAMDAGSDATTDDAATDSGVTCYPLSGPSPSLPDAIPSEFTATSPTWSRPTGETCPATGTGAVATPFDSVCYVNDTGADVDVLFEMIVGTSPIVPAVVIYDGDAVPSDVMQCASVSSDLVIDSAETTYTVPSGVQITFVATAQEPGLGTFQFVITPQ